MAAGGGAGGGAPARGRKPARGPAPPLSTAGHGRALRLGPQLHVVRAAELLLREIDLELARELAAVPGEAADELLVVVAALVPVGEQRQAVVQARALPALRDHAERPAL